MHNFQSLIFCVCTSRTFFIFLRILSTTLLHVIIDDIIFIEKKILSLSLSLKKINVSHTYPISSFMFTPHPHRQILFSSRIHFLCPFIFLPLYCITGSAQEAWTKQYSISKIPRMNKTIPPHSPLPWRFLMKCCKSHY